MVNLLLMSFLISFVVCFFIIFIFAKNNNFCSDCFDGPQKFHDKPTPRIGGIGIFLAFLGVILFINFYKHDKRYFLFFLSTLPLFLFGLAEDITKKISPKIRLLASIFSGMLAYFLLDVYLTRIDLPLIDSIFQFKIIALGFTLFAIAGVANAINIIDGYNGLAAVVSILILLALGYVGYKVRDEFIYILSFVLIGGIAGFFIWNYPFGKIFLGDGGAYFIGFTIAVLSVLLVKRHPQVSPWFPLLAVVYPVFETVFSFYRKKILRSKSPFTPDGLHFHMLVYKRVVPLIYNIHRNERLRRNSATSPLLWLICSFGIIPAVVFWQNTSVLIFFTILFCWVYVWLYRSIVKFRLGRMIKKFIP